MGGDVSAGGETDQREYLDASGRLEGQGSRPLTEEIRKLIEAGVKLKPAEAGGGAEVKACTSLSSRMRRELDLMRGQLGGSATFGRRPPDARAQSRQDSYRLRRMGLRGRGLPPQLVSPARDSGRWRRRFL
jgi:hypothetical protein